MEARSDLQGERRLDRPDTVVGGVWRESREAGELWRWSLPLCGACLGLAGLTMMATGLGPARKVLVMLPSLLGGNVAVHLVLIAQTHLRYAYASRAAWAMPAGPKHLVEIVLCREDKELGRDEGVLLVEGGRMVYEGLRTSFSIPRDRFRRSDPPKSTVVADVDGAEIELLFCSVRPLGQTESWRTLDYLLRGFEIGPSGGEFIPPPTTPAPKFRFRDLPGWPVFLFWVVLTITLIVFCHFTLENRDGRWLLICTYAATIAVASVAPISRLIKISRALRAERRRYERRETERILALTDANSSEEAEFQNLRA